MRTFLFLTIFFASKQKHLSLLKASTTRLCSGLIVGKPSLREAEETAADISLSLKFAIIYLRKIWLKRETYAFYTVSHVQNT